MLLLLAAGTASAKAIYSYTVQIRDASVNGAPGGSSEVHRLDPGQSATLRVTHLGVETYRSSVGSGGTTLSFSTANVAPGDVLEAYQPSIPAGPPGVSPDETFVVPAASINASVGSNVLSGTAPADAAAVTVRPDTICWAGQDDDYPATLAAGSFSASIPFALASGEKVQYTLYPGQGDQVIFATRTPGETPCVSVEGYASPYPPGVPAPPSPYQFNVTNLNPTVAANMRLVVSRGGSNYIDTTLAALTAASTNTAILPQPGDRIDIYRPAAAPAASASFTIPRASATYDPSNDLVAIEGDAFAYTSLSIQQTFISGGIFRPLGPMPAGRLVTDTRQPSAYDNGADLQAGDFVRATVVDAADRLRYEIQAGQGDLAAPNVTAGVAKAFRLAKISSKFKLALHANESAAATIALALPKKLPTRAHPSPFRTKSTQRIAKSNFKLNPGKANVSLRLSKSGNKALAKLRAVGKKLKPVALTITITARDASGNAVTTVQTGKVSR